MKEENIVPFIKSQRLAWYGQVNRMEDDKNVKAVMKWNPVDRRSRVLPASRHILKRSNSSSVATLLISSFNYQRC